MLRQAYYPAWRYGGHVVNVAVKRAIRVPAQRSRMAEEQGSSRTRHSIGTGTLVYYMANTLYLYHSIYIDNTHSRPRAWVARLCLVYATLRATVVVVRTYWCIVLSRSVLEPAYGTIEYYE